MQGCASAVTGKALLVWYLAGAEGDTGHHPDNVVKTTNCGAGRILRKLLLIKQLFGWEAGI